MFSSTIHEKLTRAMPQWTPSIEKPFALAIVPVGALFLHAFSNSFFDVQDQPVILLSLVVFSALLGGVVVGLFSTACFLAYTTWLISGQNGVVAGASLFEWGSSTGAVSLWPTNLSHFVIYAVLTPCLAVAGGLARERLTRAQDDGRETRTFAEEIFQKATVGIAYADLRGQILRCNPTFAELVGRGVNEVEGRHFEGFIYNEDIEADRSSVRKLVAGETESVSITSRYVRPDGRPVWVRKIVNLLRDGEGKPRRVVAFSRDISGDMAQDARLVASEIRYRALWEHSPQANILLETPDLKIDAVNDGAMKLFEARTDSELKTFTFFSLSANRQLDSESSRAQIGSYLDDLWRNGVDLH